MTRAALPFVFAASALQAGDSVMIGQALHRVFKAQDRIVQRHPLTLLGQGKTHAAPSRLSFSRYTSLADASDLSVCESEPRVVP